MKENKVLEQLKHQALYAQRSFSTELLYQTYGKAQMVMIADTAVTPDTALLYKNNFRNAQLHYIEGAVHSYDSPEHFKALKDFVVEAALQEIRSKSG